MSRKEFDKADLSEANLGGVNLSGSILLGVQLIDAGLREAYLFGTDLRVTNLTGADFESAELFETIFCDTNLTNAKNLELCIARGPSIAHWCNPVDYQKCSWVTAAYPKNSSIAFRFGCRRRQNFIPALSVTATETNPLLAGCMTICKAVAFAVGSMKNKCFQATTFMAN